MITANFIVVLIFAIVSGLIGITLFIFGLYTAFVDKDVDFCILMIGCSLCAFIFSGIMFNESHKEYKNAIPQNQVKILRQKIIDAEKELQKYMIDHPELKEYE